jgi:hypothetical protein
VHPTVGAGTRTVKQVLASSQRGDAPPARVTLAKWKLLMGEQYQDQGLIFTTATGGIL